MAGRPVQMDPVQVDPVQVDRLRADAASAPVAGGGEPLAGVRGVLLDIDHTLVDTEAAFVAALGASILPLLGPGPDADGAGDDLMAGVLDQWSADRGGWYRAYTRGEMTHAQQRHRRFDELLVDRGGRALTAEEYERANAVFESAFAAAWRAFPEVAAALARLRDAGIRLGAVTNAGRALQEAKLAAAGLADAVPLLVTVETFGVGKPDPRVFREGARLLGLAPEEVAYAGDEPDIDADGAIAAGLHGVHLHRAGDGRFAPCDPAGRRHLEAVDLLAVPAMLGIA